MSSESQAYLILFLIKTHALESRVPLPVFGVPKVFELLSFLFGFWSKITEISLPMQTLLKVHLPGRFDVRHAKTEL